MLRHALIAAITLSTSPAFAQWSAEVNGPNVFGEVEVLAIAEMEGSEDFIGVTCDSDEKMTIGWFYKSDSDANGKKLDIIIQNDKGGRGSFEAVSKDRNDTYDIFEISDKEDMLEAIEIIADSNSKIEVGLHSEKTNYKYADRISAKGSTAAMALVKKHCGHFFEQPEGAEKEAEDA